MLNASQLSSPWTPSVAPPALSPLSLFPLFPLKSLLTMNRVPPFMALAAHHMAKSAVPPLCVWTYGVWTYGAPWRTLGGTASCSQASSATRGTCLRPWAGFRAPQRMGETLDREAIGPWKLYPVMFCSVCDPNQRISLCKFKYVFTKIHARSKRLGDARCCLLFCLGTVSWLLPPPCSPPKSPTLSAPRTLPSRVTRFLRAKVRVVLAPQTITCSPRIRSATSRVTPGAE